MTDPDTTTVLDALRETYGCSAWAAIRSNGQRACGDGLGAFGLGSTWEQAITALCISRAALIGVRLDAERKQRDWTRGMERVAAWLNAQMNERARGSW